LSELNILYVAEIVGKAGIYAFKKGLAQLKKQRHFDLVIAGANGATSGAGLGRNHAGYLHKLGADVLTTSDCCFYKKDLVADIEHIPYLLRPENLSPEAPGYGVRVYECLVPPETGRTVKIAVAVLIGQSGFPRMHGENPYLRLPVLLERLRAETPYIILEFAARATAEKHLFFQTADGGSSAVIGSLTRVQTADEAILPGGTAVITDAGRTGSRDSVGGCEIASRVQEYLTGIPEWTKDTWAGCELQGVALTLDSGGKATAIERIRLPVADPSPQDVKASS
jgi:metallophosphoesterase (TIGR00282 family)